MMFPPVVFTYFLSLFYLRNVTQRTLCAASFRKGLTSVVAFIYILSNCHLWEQMDQNSIVSANFFCWNQEGAYK